MTSSIASDGTSGQKQDPGRLRVCIVRSLDEISQESWDRLAAQSGFYLSHAWLRTYEDNPRTDPAYVLVNDGEHLIAALPITTVQEETNERYDVRRVYGAASYPEVILGSRRGYRSALLLDSETDLHVRTAALHLLRDGAHGLIGDRPARFWYVPDSDLESCLEFVGARCGPEIGQDAMISIPSGGFEEYTTTLPNPRKIKRERRVFLERGYDTAIEPLSDVASEIGPLLHQLESKYGSTKDVGFYIKYFELLADSADPGEVLTCRRNGKVLGFCHFYTFGGGIWGRTVGFDYPHLADGFEYFNLVFYELVELGAQRGQRRLHLGIGSLDAKIRRGARIESLWLVNIDTQEAS